MSGYEHAFAAEERRRTEPLRNAGYRDNPRPQPRAAKPSRWRLLLCRLDIGKGHETNCGPCEHCGVSWYGC